MSELFEALCCCLDCDCDCDGDCYDCKDCCDQSSCFCGACCVWCLEDAAIETAFDGHIREDHCDPNEQQRERHRRRQRHKDKHEPKMEPRPPAVQLISQRPISWQSEASSIQGATSNGGVINTQPVAGNHLATNTEPRYGRRNKRKQKPRREEEEDLSHPDNHLSGEPNSASWNTEANRPERTTMDDSTTNTQPIQGNHLPYAGNGTNLVQDTPIAGRMDDPEIDPPPSYEEATRQNERELHNGDTKSMPK